MNAAVSIHEAGHSLAMFLHPELAAAWNPGGVACGVSSDGRCAGAVYSGPTVPDLFAEDKPHAKSPDVLLVEVHPECTPALLAFTVAGRAAELELSDGAESLAGNVTFNTSTDGQNARLILAHIYDGGADGWSPEREQFIHASRHAILVRTRGLFRQPAVAAATRRLATELERTPVMPWPRVQQILSESVGTCSHGQVAVPVNSPGQSPLDKGTPGTAADKASSATAENATTSQQQHTAGVGTSEAPRRTETLSGAAIAVFHRRGTRRRRSLRRDGQ